MIQETKQISLKVLKELLEYNPTTGNFIWKIHKNRVNPGDMAGCIDGNGYISITLFRKQYRAHRLAWLYVYGEWPEGFLDHINRNPTDNRICNLRVSDPLKNGQNRVKAASHSSTGKLGITKFRNKFSARIQVKGKRIHLGVYSTQDEAEKAYKEAKRIYHPLCS